MDVEILKTNDPVCEAFVAQRPEGKICHLPAWSNAVTQAMGLQSFYLTVRDSDGLHGVLPLVQVKSRLFGNFMVSGAFSDYGGMVVDSNEAGKALFDRAVELATEHGCESIEFRNVEPLDYDLHLRSDKLTMLLALSPEPDELWKQFRGEIRNRVRKAEKSGLTATSGGVELLDEFYRTWTVRMRQLGTPCYPSKLMRSILEAFPNNSRIFIVRLGGEAIGGGFTTCFNGVADMQWVSTLTKYNRMAPNNLLYWSVIKHYCLEGAKCFDFGRCTVDGPTYEFKRRWGAEQVQLHYQYWAKPGRELSIISPSSSKYKKKVEMWKRMPLWLTRLLGPYISRNLP